MNESGRINRTKTLAVTAIFSAVYAVMRIIPTVPMIGVEGAYFSVADILAPIYGIILGPYVGGTSVLIGTFIGMSAKPPVFLGLDFLPGFINAVALGFLMKRKWLPIVILNAALLLGFVMNPLTVNFINVGFAVPFAWMHIVALLVLASPIGRKASQWVEACRPKRMFVGFAILAFIGTMMQHLTGNILYENIFVYVNQFMTPESLALRWNVVFFLYPWERIVLIIMAVIVGVPLALAVKRTLLPTQITAQRAI